LISQSKLNNLEKQQQKHSHESCGEECGGERDYLLDYPLGQRRVLRALEVLQEKRAELEAQFRAEVVELEKKYLAKYQPLYADRASLVAGEREPLPEEYAGLPESQVAEVDASGAELVSASGLPGFWLTVLRNHPDVSQLVCDNDAPALGALKDIQVHYLAGNPGFRLDFLFGPNDFFSNAVLSKEYHLENPTSVEYDQLVYDHAVGTPIAWKEGKNLCFRTVTKTQRQKNGKGTRVVRRQEPCESFFHFFSPPTMGGPDDDDDEDARDPDELEEQLQLDYDLGDIIKSQVVPMAADWFTGKALEYADYDEEEDYDYSDEEDEEDSEEEDDDESDDSDESEDESEDEGPRAKNTRRPQKGPASSTPAGPNQEQCKQQ
jgi:nucleosome assembly protein 1-like 1